MPSTLPYLRTRTRLGAKPLELWHLLSLDAPTVAVLWTWFIAASVHIALPLASLLAMGLAVWMLYAADRLLDARHLSGHPLDAAELEHRHHFHHRHRSVFLAGIVAASVTLSVLIPRLSPAAVHLDLALGALLAGYFLLIHVAGSAHRLPKEIAVGLFFSAAVFIPTVSRAGELRPKLLPEALLFALLCSLNCLYIYRWEHPVTPEPTEAHPRLHPLTRRALRYLHPLTIALLCASAAEALHTHSLLPAAILPSALLLLFLDRRPNRLHAITLRAAADLSLTTPLLFLPYLLHLSSS